jgi:hypothetical protein
MTMISDDRLREMHDALNAPNLGMLVAQGRDLSDLREAVNELLSLRTSPPPSGEAGEGWVLVPREPTAEMLEAAERFEDNKDLSDWGKMIPITYAETWSVMIGALPTIKEPTDGK